MESVTYLLIHLEALLFVPVLSYYLGYKAGKRKARLTNLSAGFVDGAGRRRKLGRRLS